jgi:hypothetical protein
MDPCSKFCGTMFLMNVMCLLVCVLFKFKLELKSDEIELFVRH